MNLIYEQSTFDLWTHPFCLIVVRLNFFLSSSSSSPYSSLVWQCTVHNNRYDRKQIKTNSIGKSTQLSPCFLPCWFLEYKKTFEKKCSNLEDQILLVSIGKRIQRRLIMLRRLWTQAQSIRSCFGAWLMNCLGKSIDWDGMEKVFDKQFVFGDFGGGGLILMLRPPLIPARRESVVLCFRCLLWLGLLVFKINICKGNELWFPPVLKRN